MTSRHEMMQVKACKYIHVSSCEEILFELKPKALFEIFPRLTILFRKICVLRPGKLFILNP